MYIRIKNHDLYKIDFNRFNASISSIIDIKTCHQSTESYAMPFRII